MQFKLIFVFSLLIFIPNSFSNPVIGQKTLVYAWNYVNYTFQTQEETDEYFNNKYYENVFVAGVKVDSFGRYFVTTPRWKEGIPATLGIVITDAEDNLYIQPYPSWEMNKLGDPNALQSVLGFEIDNQDRIWILDQGKCNGSAAINGSIKLLIYDLKTDNLIQKYVFSESEASLSNSFLNDIVVDVVDGFGYISDSGLPLVEGDELDGGILVYDFNKNTAKRVLNHQTCTQNSSLWISINGEHVYHDQPMETGADGIALSPDRTVLVFCPLTSRTNYRINTEYLKNWKLNDNELVQHVVSMPKLSASDGLAFGNNSVLFVTGLETSSIYSYDNPIQNPSKFEILTSDTQSMLWPDTIGFDHQGNIVVVSNQLHKFLMNELVFNLTNPMDFINFRIWKIYADCDSYLFYSSPQPSSTSSSSSSNTVRNVFIALTAVFAVGFIFLLINQFRLHRKYKPRRMFSPETNSLLN